jgi:carboxyl-terminal processing protease
LATLQGQQFPQQTLSADPTRFLTDAPMAVIVNRGTYGGAELTAAAIEDLKRGDVVGERTFGEGSVQKTIDLPDGAALMLTVAKYQSPSGKKIQDEAVVPTSVVVSPQEDEDEGVTPPNGDEMLNKALDLLKAKGA